MRLAPPGGMERRRCAPDRSAWKKAVIRCLAVLLALTAVPAAAHHRQTPPIVQFTATGETALPRVPAFGNTVAFAVEEGTGHRIVTASFQFPTTRGSISGVGDNDNPTVSGRGSPVAWDSDDDPLGSGDPGRQVFIRSKGTVKQVTHDPTGTSVNPALDGRGARVAFESTGDLAGTGNAGARQIFLGNAGGNPIQVSQGRGSSRNAVMSVRGRVLAFDSTSDPITGNDTGIAQIWFTTTDASPARPITAGLGASRNPALSPEGRLVAFESSADLAGTGIDTGVSQIFVWDSRTNTFAQITTDAGGCSGPSLQRYGKDWRIGFTCGGQGFFYSLRTDTLCPLPINGGNTPRVALELGIHFIMVSTTADLLRGTGTTPGHELYLLNLFKLPLQPISKPAIWFPSRGLLPLRQR
jgi:Tol biopolymer transport system component